MNSVEPIKNEEDIKKLKDLLSKQNYRDYLLLVFSINTGMKITDILSLKFSDLMNNYKHFYSSINKNNIEYILNSFLLETLKNYYNMLEDNDDIMNTYVFKSRKGKDPIDRSHAYRILNNAAKIVGIDTNVGPHTLRKTFGYHYYKQHKDIKFLQKLFKHSSSKRTFQYIGLEELTRDIDSSKEFSL